MHENSKDARAASHVISLQAKVIPLKNVGEIKTKPSPRQQRQQHPRYNNIDLSTPRLRHLLSHSAKLSPHAYVGIIEYRSLSRAAVNSLATDFTISGTYAPPSIVAPPHATVQFSTISAIPRNEQGDTPRGARPGSVKGKRKLCDANPGLPHCRGHTKLRRRFGSTNRERFVD